MAKYLLDTTVLIDHLRGRREVLSFLKGLAKDGDLLGTCDINVAELYAGLAPPEQTKADRLIDSLEFYVASREAVKEAGRYKFRFAREGITVTTSDALIAATATQENAVLVTANVKDFPMQELKVLPQP